MQKQNASIKMTLKVQKGIGNVCVLLNAIDDTYYNSKISAKLAEVLKIYFLIDFINLKMLNFL